MIEQSVMIRIQSQTLDCFHEGVLFKRYLISSGKKGVGEQVGSECTPRGKHCVHEIIGIGYPINSVFVAREWTGEIYHEALSCVFPGRDWILSRIIRLQGCELGRNLGGNVDTLKRFIYIHGTPDSNILGAPSSHGCIRMHNDDVIELADWVKIGTPILIEG